jgi:hypothetical protein
MVFKQAPHDWNELINATLLSLGYSRCKTDPCLYIKRSQTGRLIFMPLFVDDMFPAYHKDDTLEWENDKKQLFNKFKMKDLGDAKLILGMRVLRQRIERTLIIDQEIYINRMLESCNMDTCYPVATPEEDGIKHSALTRPNSNTGPSASESATPSSDPASAKSEQLEHNFVQSFHSIIGSLLYAALSTRPDISHAVITLSRFVSNPLKPHWTALKRILQYLKGTAKLGLVFRGKQFKTINTLSEITLGPMFTDANWAGDIDDRKSTTGLVLKINGCTISWKSKKQSVVSVSSAESEYMSLGEGVREILWLRQFMLELNRCAYGEKAAKINLASTPVMICCDNNAAIAIASNDMASSRVKHIDIRHHFIRDHIKKNEISLQWISTAEQQADIFTKALGKNIFLTIRSLVMGH